MSKKTKNKKSRPGIEPFDVIYDRAYYMERLGIPFVLRKINNTFTLESEYFGDFTSRSNNRLTNVELTFIKKIKKYILDNEIDALFLENRYYPEDIKYVDMSKKAADSVFLDCIEIDVDEAYWKTAHSLGIIPDNLYAFGSKEAKNISKLGRLVSLGALAKKESIYHFDGKRIRKTVNRSERTENVWYTICKRLSDAMDEAKKMAGDDFLLYWVDGIYIKNNPDLMLKIIDLFESFGYATKIKSNLTVKYFEERLEVLDPNEKNEKKSTRPFNIQKKTRHLSYFMDTELRETARKYSKFGVIDEIDI